MEIKYKQRN